MKRIGNILVLGWLACVWVAVVALPLILSHVDVLSTLTEAARVLEESPIFHFRDVPWYVGTTCLWGLLTAASATSLAIPVGLGIGASRSRWARDGLLAASLMTACLPPYMIFWSLGLLRLPGSGVGDLLATGPSWLNDAAGAIQIWLGLTFWIWPLPALIIGAGIRRIPASRIELIELDYRNSVRRRLAIVRQVPTAVLAGFGTAFLVAISAAIVYNLASGQSSGIQTYSEVLRRLFAETWDDRATLLASAPMVLFGLIAAAILLRMLRERPSSEGVDDREPGLKHLTLGWFIPVLTLGGPVVIMSLTLKSVRPFLELTSTDGRVLGNGLILAGITGLIMGSLTIAASYAWFRGRDRPGFMRVLRLGSLGWLWMSLLPALTIGTSLVVTYNRSWLLWIYDTPAMMILGYLARYGFLIVFLSWWVSQTDRRLRGDLQTMDGVRAFSDWIQTAGASAAQISLAGGLLGGLLSFGEISTTVIVTPPGFQSPAERLLNRLHYAREDAAMAFSLLMVGLVAIICILAARWMRPIFSPRMSDSPAAIRRPARRLDSSAGRVLLFCLIAFLVSCGRGNSSTKSDESEPTAGAHAAPTIGVKANEAPLIVGGTGRTNGKFIYPRAMDVDSARNRMYVVDRSGRIQVFDLAGNHLATWPLERFDRGFPTGISVNPATGLVYLADTHNHRVVVYQPDGTIDRKFGEYGTEPGQFIYPTDIAFAPDGRTFVSEYGGNDRIQIFSAEGQYLSEFGEYGREGPVAFSRPQSIAYDSEHDELWITDSCNHRIIITRSNGEPLKAIGTYGTERGSFSYPYGLALLEDGTALVTEFGSSRIQRIDRTGKSLGMFGGFGQNPGELHCPWTATFADDRLFVLDSKNNRVQIFTKGQTDGLFQ